MGAGIKFHCNQMPTFFFKEIIHINLHEFICKCKLHDLCSHKIYINHKIYIYTNYIPRQLLLMPYLVQRQT